MDFLLEALTNWLKEMLVGGIMSNLSGMFDSVNQQVADISVQVGQTPQGWNGNIFSMIENLSNSIMVPIAGVILAIVMTVDLIQMIADKNNLHDVDTWMIFKWVFKSAAAILIVTNTWNIVMGVFDMAQSVVAQAAGIINSDASIDISSVMTDLEPRLMEMDLGPLFGLWFQSLFIGITMWALYICIFIVIYGRMIEIYLVTSVAPVPMAAMMSKEWGGMGQNYLRSLLALGFQAFLICLPGRPEKPCRNSRKVLSCKSSNRNRLPISLPPRRNRSRSDEQPQAQAGCAGSVLGVRRRTGTDPSKDAAIRDREFERLSAENGCGRLCGAAGFAGTERTGIPAAPEQQQLKPADPQGA